VINYYFEEPYELEVQVRFRGGGRRGDLSALPDLVLIDYLQLMNDSTNTKSCAEEVSKILNELKNIAFPYWLRPN
jgi:replicative DNA helicase